jgi:hypothetical protein
MYGLLVGVLSDVLPASHLQGACCKLALAHCTYGKLMRQIKRIHVNLSFYGNPRPRTVRKRRNDNFEEGFLRGRFDWRGDKSPLRGACKRVLTGSRALGPAERHGNESRYSGVV